MKSFFLNLIIVTFLLSLNACCTNSSVPVDTSWKEDLAKEIPLLGHRNWIVVTDMAYPLQSQPGIRTVYTGESYMDILSFVQEEISKAPHITPITYQDEEFLYLSDKEAQGIVDIQQQMKELFGNSVMYLPHEELIERLDNVSQTFHVTILKSTLTIPYTTVFFELDCDYWDQSHQQQLQLKMDRENE